MEAKFVVVLALVTLGHSSVVPVAKLNNDYTKFAYDVADPNTGDYKSQVETRVGGNVQGQYSLLESDGTKRIVDYAADDINGFNAIVRKEPAVIGASVVSGVNPEIIGARSLVTGSLIAPTPNVASRVVVAQSPAIISSPGIISAPGVIDARTYAAPAVVTGSASGLIDARTYSSPALVAGSTPALFAAAKYGVPSAPVVTIPYGVASPSYASSFLAAPGITKNLASAEAASYLSSYSYPLKY